MKNLFLFSIIFLLFSCATPYQRKSFTGGYSEIRIDDNIFHVSFKGNSKTSEERAVDFAMLRSAEITLNNGYKYFSIIKNNKEIKEDIYYNPSTYNTYLTIKPRVFFKIRCFHDKPKKHSYNAQFLYQSIKEKYRIK